MQARMKNPVLIRPDALQALLALDKTTESVPYVTRKLVHLRASQINGCSVCVDMHARELKKAGESDDRIFAVSAWRDAPYFNDAERAALSLTEAVTRSSDRRGSGARRRLAGGCPPLRRAVPGGPPADHRRDQRLESRQRRHPRRSPANG